MTWQDEAACKGLTGMFFPVRGEPTKPAKQVCAACPVRAECLAFALDGRETVGIWGGMSERQRRAERRRHRGLPHRHTRHQPRPDALPPWASDVTAEHGATVADVLGRSQLPEVVAARWALFRALDEHGWSAAQIGRVCGRHPSTVLNALGRLAKNRETL